MRVGTFQISITFICSYLDEAMHSLVVLLKSYITTLRGKIVHIKRFYINSTVYTY